MRETERIPERALKNDWKVRCRLLDSDCEAVVIEAIGHYQWVEFDPGPDGFSQVTMKANGALIVAQALGLEAPWERA